MSASALKKDIYRAVDNIDDENFLKVVYLLLNEKSKEFEYEFSAAEKKELDNLHKLHKAGKSKSYTMDEVRKHAHSKLKK
jgi:hypothetical protein